MNILILGSGGREHTFAWKIAKSQLCSKLFVAPGNGGTSSVATNIDIQVNDFEGIAAFVLKENIELILVGPEDPLVNGIVDYFQKNESLQSINIVGPDAYSAQMEGSKAFSKIFMKENGIPTAKYCEFDSSNREDGVKYIKAHPLPIVLKADGLAAGKGVLIIDNYQEAITEFNAMLEGKFGAASSKIVIEQFLDGIEFSVFVLTDGNDYKVLPIAKDYKRIGESDTGLNTGGMGAISPVPFVDDIMMQKVITKIVEPTMHGIRNRKMNYKGFIFIGLINVNGEPFVIEYNCRMGDPETEVVIPRLENDFVILLNSLFDGSLKCIDINENHKTAATIMMVAGGYPGDYKKGDSINIPKEINGTFVFHAGTKLVDNQLVTNGGRVLAVTTLEDSLDTAVSSSLNIANKITFNGKYFRTDIGKDVI
jgi:phosphoribosylamine---glycine ligase